MWSGRTINILLGCPPESLRWAGAGYQAGVEDGEEQGRRLAEDEMARRWALMAKAIRDVGRMPLGVELEAKRTPDFGPCRQKCGRCSRCICAEARERRGGRDYQGALAEQLIAEAQAGAA